MKNIIILLVFVIVSSTLISGCTGNQRARKVGGTYTVNLPECQKLVTATWKDSNLWYLTRDMRKSDVPERYTFKEDSSLGVFEGTVIFKESCVLTNR